MRSLWVASLSVELPFSISRQGGMADTCCWAHFGQEESWIKEKLYLWGKCIQQSLGNMK